jgi:hypothetical protein
VDERGYPVPKFVHWIDGKPDFRVVDVYYFKRAVEQRLCWICGERLGRHMAFVLGPMCSINRINSEPPSHLDCARFAVQACPFMVHPERKRNEMDLPEEGIKPAGIMIARNPGAIVIWVTESYKPFKAPNGILFHVGEPTSLEWYARGRKATREEVMESINTGLPFLRNVAEMEGPDAVAEFKQQVERGLQLVPAE